MFRLRFISFIFFTVIMPTLGCAIINKGEHMLVRKLDAVLLTANDGPTMEVDAVTNHRIRGVVKEPPVIDGFVHAWDGTQPEEHITN